MPLSMVVAVSHLTPQQLCDGRLVVVAAVSGVVNFPHLHRL